MKKIVVSFAMVLWMTFMAFISVTAHFPSTFIHPFIFLLCIVQVIFQLYYFMHLKDDHHEIPKFFLYSTMVVIFPMILAFEFLPK